VDLTRVEGLDDAARRRLATLAGRRLGADGILRVTAQESRDRFRNLEDARGKVRDLLERAQVVPRPRRATRLSHAVKEQRLREKKRAGAVKAARRSVREEES
jgi:ribosome-associated protein